MEDSVKIAIEKTNMKSLVFDNFGATGPQNFTNFLQISGVVFFHSCSIFSVNPSQLKVVLCGHFPGKGLQLDWGLGFVQATSLFGHLPVQNIFKHALQHGRGHYPAWQLLADSENAQVKGLLIDQCAPILLPITTLYCLILFWMRLTCSLAELQEWCILHIYV